jgi:hypothetical protein
MLKPGDELKLRIDPLRSGAPGGLAREEDQLPLPEQVVTH